MMTYQHIVIDASLFLCLMKAGMLDVLFRLPWQNHTTVYVLSELRDSRQRPLLDQLVRENRLKVRESLALADEVREMASMQTRHKACLTIAECSAFMLAENLHCPLLTTDKTLRLIVQDKVEVYGLGFVLHQCVCCGVMDEKEAKSALKRLLTYNPALLRDEDTTMKSMDTMT